MHVLCAVCVGRDTRSIGTARRAGRVSLTAEPQLGADDVQSALAAAVVSLRRHVLPTLLLSV